MKHLVPAGWLALWLAVAGLLAIAPAPLHPPEEAPLGPASAVLAGHDTLSHDYPAFWWGWSEAREQGLLPLWNPSWLGGLPFIASQTFMPFYPPNWLGRWLPFPLAFNIQYPLHLILAAAAMAWACRRRGLGWWAAGLGALAWGMSGHLATLVGPGHIQKLQTLAWLPLVATGLRELAGRHPRRGLLPLGLGLALQITAGHLQIVYLSLAAGALEALAVLVARLIGSRSGAKHLSQNILHAGIAFAIALGLSAVFWVPTVEFAGLSNRQGALSWEDATRGSLPPEEVFEFALPRLLGDSLNNGRGQYLGRYGESSPGADPILLPERVVSDYVGAGALLFALLGLLLPGRRRMAAGFLALAAGALVLSMGKYLPWGSYQWALNWIPGLSHFRSPSTMMALLSYGIALAAAIGVDGLVGLARGGDAASRRRLGMRLGLALLLVASLALVGMLASEVGTESAAAVNRAALAHWMVATLVVFGVALSWTLAVGRGRMWLSHGLLALLALVWAADLHRNARPFWRAEPVQSVHNWLTSHWALERWDTEDVPVRYLEYLNELSNHALTLNDYLRFRQIGTPIGYHPLGYRRHFELIDRLGLGHPNFRRLLGVQYLIVPSTGFEIPDGWYVVLRHEDQVLIHHPDIRYIREVRHLRIVEDFSAALERLAGARFNPYDSTTVTIEDAAHRSAEFNPAVGMATQMAPLHLQARVFPQGPGRIELRLTARNSGLVALAEPAVPGWRLWIEGRDFSNLLGRVDSTFLAIYVPAGQSEMLLTYDPASQRLGLFLTLLTLAMLAFLGGRIAATRYCGRRPHNTIDIASQPSSGDPQERQTRSEP